MSDKGPVKKKGGGKRRGKIGIASGGAAPQPSKKAAPKKKIPKKAPGKVIKSGEMVFSFLYLVLFRDLIFPTNRVTLIKIHWTWTAESKETKQKEAAAAKLEEDQVLPLPREREGAEESPEMDDNNNDYENEREENQDFSDDSGGDYSDDGDEGEEGYRPGGYHPVSVGQRYHTRYTVLQKLGWGHFSTVWMVRESGHAARCIWEPSYPVPKRDRTFFFWHIVCRIANISISSSSKPTNVRPLTSSHLSYPQHNPPYPLRSTIRSTKTL